jgi:putative peptide zinc metalloprotease protein
VTAADAAFLIETKLRPLGVLRHPDGHDPEVVRANPLLALRLKYVVTDPERTGRLTAPFAALFRPGIALAVLAVFAASVWWLMFDKGLGSATHEAFHDPRLLLLVIGLTILSAGFHEFGHAAACRYGGATPGAMGAGLYLVWPAFYTDVTDSYRLSRWGRLRVDVGGLYFNAVFAVGIMGAWWLTRWDALLLVVATQVLQMARQLTPLVRFDGYHILADLTGVPDLFLHLKPTLLALWPGNWGKPENKVLKPWARAVVVTWVLLVVPVLAALLVALVVVFPRLVATAWAGLLTQVEVLGQNWADGDLASVGVRVVSMLSLAIPALSVAYLLTRIARRTARRVWAMAGDDAHRRLAVLLAGMTLCSALAWAWWPGDSYVPVEAADRGVVQDLFPVASLPPAPIADEPEQEEQEGQEVLAAPATAPAPAPTPVPATVPTADEVQVAVAVGDTDLDAGDSTAAKVPTDRGPWPFPWERPAVLGDGDNLSLAVTTRDRRAEYDVALSEVWVHDGAPVRHVNAAHAYTACIDCSAVAAAYQAVFIVGTDTTEVVPENHAVAATYECERCVAHAVSVQTVATLTGMPDGRTRAEIARLLRSLEGLHGEIRQLTALEVYARMKSVEGQLLRLLDERDYLALGWETEDADELTEDARPSDEIASEGDGHDGDASDGSRDPDAAGERALDADGDPSTEDGTASSTTADRTSTEHERPAEEGSTAGSTTPAATEPDDPPVDGEDDTSSGPDGDTDGDPDDGPDGASGEGATAERSDADDTPDTPDADGT